MELQQDTIPTFSEALDDILGGGIKVGNIIQICGSPGSGKTQLIMQLCLDVQIPVSLGGLSSSAIYIDSERAFTLRRLKEMAGATVDLCKRVAEVHNLLDDVKGLSVDKLVEGVSYIEVNGHVELLAALCTLEAYLKENKVKIVVLDSLTMCLLALSDTLERTRYLASVIKKFRTLAQKHSFAVAIVNDLTTWISTKGEKVLLPSLGESASHLFPDILLLSRHSQYSSALLYKSSSLPQRLANFVIGKEGIRDGTRFEK